MQCWLSSGLTALPWLSTAAHVLETRILLDAAPQGSEPLTVPIKAGEMATLGEYHLISWLLAKGHLRFRHDQGGNPQKPG